MAEQRKRSSGSLYESAGAYIDGNTARRLDEIPAGPSRKRETVPRRVSGAARAQKPREVSSQVKKNREKTMLISKGYVLFLTAACVLIVFCSIHYLRLQTEITSRKKTVAAMENELNQLKEENDAYYSQVTSGVDLTEIKEAAIGRLGMKLPDEDQIQTYETEGRSYVRQFQEVPDSK